MILKERTKSFCATNTIQWTRKWKKWCNTTLCRYGRMFKPWSFRISCPIFLVVLWRAWKQIFMYSGSRSIDSISHLKNSIRKTIQEASKNSKFMSVLKNSSFSPHTNHVFNSFIKSVKNHSRTRLSWVVSNWWVEFSGFVIEGDASVIFKGEITWLTWQRNQWSSLVHPTTQRRRKYHLWWWWADRLLQALPLDN